MDFNRENAANYGISCAAGYTVIKYPPRTLFNLYKQNFRKPLSEEENNIYRQAGLKLYNESDYLKQIAEIKQLDETNFQNIIDEQEQKINRLVKNPIRKFIYKRRLKRFKIAVKETAEGKNAFCTRGDITKNRKSVISINLNKNAQAIFHEFGHAVNAYSNDYKTILQKVKSIRKTIPFIFFSAFLTERKNNPVTQKDKAVNKLKDNCGILAAAVSVPTLIEEGLASVNGAKLAKNVFDEEMIKKVNKNNLKAWSTYMLSTVLYGTTIQAGVYIKDKMYEKKPVEYLAKLKNNLLNKKDNK